MGSILFCKRGERQQRAEFDVVIFTAVGKCPAEKSNGPLAKTASGQGIGLNVKIPEKGWGGSPVEAQIQILEGIHDGVLQHGDIDNRGKEVEADEVPVEVAQVIRGGGRNVGVGVIVRLLIDLWAKSDDFVGCSFPGENGDGIFDNGTEGMAAVQPDHKQLKDVGRLARKPDKSGW